MLVGLGISQLVMHRIATVANLAGPRGECASRQRERCVTSEPEATQLVSRCTQIADSSAIFFNDFP
jgi:hypothetical protein